MHVGLLGLNCKLLNTFLRVVCRFVLRRKGVESWEDLGSPGVNSVQRTGWKSPGKGRVTGVRNYVFHTPDAEAFLDFLASSGMWGKLQWVREYQLLISFVGRCRWREGRAALLTSVLLALLLRQEVARHKTCWNNLDVGPLWRRNLCDSAGLS